MVKLTIDDINKLQLSQFVDLFKNVIEHWSIAAESTFSHRPFASLIDLVDNFSEYLDNLSVEDKVAVLKSHPDLAGKLLDENKLTSESAAEQASVGLNKLTSEQKTELVQLNTKYSQLFGFPFVICVRENNKIDRILNGFRERLPNSRDQEVINGIEQVKKICQLRIENVVE